MQDDDDDDTLLDDNLDDDDLVDEDEDKDDEFHLQTMSERAWKFSPCLFVKVANSRGSFGSSPCRISFTLDDIGGFVDFADFGQCCQQSRVFWQFALSDVVHLG